MVESIKEQLLYADRWIAPPRALDVWVADWTEFAEYLESEQRNPVTVDNVALQYLHLVPTEDAEQARRVQRKAYSGIMGTGRSVDHATEQWMTGTIEEVRTTLDAYEQQGSDEVILHPVAHMPSELDRQLRLYRRFLLSEYP